MENIRVYIRLKPTKESEQNFKAEKNSLINMRSKECFNFDGIISATSTNEEIFTSLIRDILGNVLKGINVSIFAYGQTSTGKTYTMKGKSLNGIIPLSIKELFSKISNEEIQKSIMKISYCEIYNETVNDLIDSSKKNLEIRESYNKGVMVNNLTEIIAENYEKVIQLLNTGENNRVIAETKLNEKSSRSHTIFRIQLMFSKEVNGKEKKFTSCLNLVDLAGSENVSKAKTEGIRLKEGTNINKSLLALSNVISKLSQNSKNFVNYRDSKLTRLLQSSLGGNSKTAIICTVADDNGHYQETLNTLHFGLKAKNVKTTVKINEVSDEKSKILMENNQLKSKIKILEDLINEKKEKTEGINFSILNTEQKKEEKNQTEQISQLEKEVSFLKKMMMNNKEDMMTDDMDLYSVNSANLRHNLLQSGYKTGKKFQDTSAIKSVFGCNFPDNLTTARRNCMTYSIHKTANKDFDFPMSNDFSFKENEELRRNIYEIKKTYYEIIQSKENQIKLLNQNHAMTMENCERLIKEAVDNYSNLKFNYDQITGELKEKNDELNQLKIQNTNMETSINYYKTEMSKMKDLNFLTDLEEKLNKEKEEKEKLKDQIKKKKVELDEWMSKYNQKVNECENLRTDIENVKKASEKGIAKLRIENKNLRNASRGKGGSENIKGKGTQIKETKIITKYEEKIAKLEQENQEHKMNLEKIQQTQIVEYQKLLDEAFEKIKTQNKDLSDYKEKVKFLEKTLSLIGTAQKSKETPIRDNIIKTTSIKSERKFLSSDYGEDEPNGNENLLGKKRKFLPKIYQNILENKASASTKTPSKKDNVNLEISTFQI